MSKIFVSYRREDSGPIARRLADSLAHSFGPNAVFIDTDTIRSAQNWKNEIDKALQESSVLIAVIGPRWLLLQDKDGRRRIDNKNDWVRAEIRSSFEGPRSVLPVLVSGGTPPTTQALPESLQKLADIQAYVLDDKFWERDVQFLIKRLEDLGIPAGSLDSTRADVPFPVPIDTSKELTDIELKEALTGLPSWKVVQRTLPSKPGRQSVELYRIFKFKSFEDAIHFMSTAARFVTNTGHHPDWQNVWVSVQVWLTTWDIGHRPTFKDVRLAEYLERLYSDYMVS